MIIIIIIHLILDNKVKVLCGGPRWYKKYCVSKKIVPSYSIFHTQLKKENADP